MRIKNWTKLKSPELWEAWKSNFLSVTEAEVTAIWIANRLVKEHARSVRRTFYEVKNGFIQAYQNNLIEGRSVRVERRSCYDCGGSGDDGGSYCDRCEGSGIYSERTLFLHEFLIKGQRYSFHSYEAPVQLSETLGEDLESYGGDFTDEEIKAFALPLSGLLRMLRWVYAARGFQGADKPALVSEKIGFSDEMVRQGFRDEEKSDHPANCFCQFEYYSKRRAV